MGPSNALLAMIAQGAQPRMADAMARGYGQGNAMLQAQQAQADRNALAKIAQARATGGLQAGIQTAGQLGQYEPLNQMDTALYGRGRDAVGDQRDARNFGYRQQRDKVGDQFRNQDFSFRRQRAQVGDSQFDRQFDAGRSDAAFTRDMQQKRFAADQAFRSQRVKDPTQVYQTRAQVAQQMGIEPNSPAYQSYVLTGKLPDAPGSGRGAKPTVDSSKAAGFLDRMVASEKVLSSDDVVSSVVDPYSGRLNRIANQGISPLGPIGPTITLPREMQDENYLKFDQAKRDFINAVLRRESGAVISDREFANAEQQYFPQPGEPPALIEQKRQNRLNAIKGIERAAQPSLAGDGQSQAAPNASSMKTKYGLQ
jgi:hypothetical protein